MPRYDFRCSKCGLEFEVQRPISKATDPVSCPNDGTEAERVFTMPVTFTKGAAEAPSSTDSTPQGSQWSHHGHSHGPGGHSHTH